MLCFAIYWFLWCFLVPAYILKSFKSVFSLFKSVKPRFGDKPDITLFLICWPVIISLIFAFIPRFQNIMLYTLLFSVLLGFFNGFAEEILWRGVYNTIFPGKIWMGYIYPSIFFTLWHVCPISVMASRYEGGITLFLVVSLLVGLSWGYYTRKTGSIRWGAIMHSIFDTLGLAGLMYASWFY